MIMEQNQYNYTMSKETREGTEIMMKYLARLNEFRDEHFPRDWRRYSDAMELALLAYLLSEDLLDNILPPINLSKRPAMPEIKSAKNEKEDNL